MSVPMRKNMTSIIGSFEDIREDILARYVSNVAILAVLNLSYYVNRQRTIY